jgi:hypothetical protein
MNDEQWVPDPAERQNSTPDGRQKRRFVYRDRVLERLTRRFLTGWPLPPGEPNVASVVLFHQLYRCVSAEGYGE